MGLGLAPVKGEGEPRPYTERSITFDEKNGKEVIEFAGIEKSTAVLGLDSLTVKLPDFTTVMAPGDTLTVRYYDDGGKECYWRTK